MRLSIRHETVYSFEQPASAVLQTLRLTPRNSDGQHVARWRMDIDRNCRLRPSEDAFGNLTHAFAVEGPVESLSVLVEGDIDTTDTGGVVGSRSERFPPELYLRETPLTALDPEIAAFAARVAADEGEDADRLKVAHGLLAALHGEMTFEPGQTDANTTAAEAFRLKRGVCQDLTHVMLAAARSLGIPARYAGGYFRRADDVLHQDAGHAWAELHMPHIGWVGFDPANGFCVTEAHVRVAIGLDYLGAAPVRGTRYGGGGETLTVAVTVQDARAARSYRR